MTNAVSYLRISTDKQGKDGLGIEAQRSAVLAFAKAKGLTIAGEFVDEASGADQISKRPALGSALSALTDGSVLLVAKMDRLSRDKEMFAWIDMKVRTRGATIMSAAGDSGDESPMGRALRGITEVFAILERDQIKARTRDALAAAKARGQKTGGRVPYGFKCQVRFVTGGKSKKFLVEDPKEQEMIRKVRGWRAEGHGAQRIGHMLTEHGYKPRKGTKWWNKVVAQMFEEAA